MSFLISAALLSFSLPHSSLVTLPFLTLWHIMHFVMSKPLLEPTNLTTSRFLDVMANNDASFCQLVRSVRHWHKTYKCSYLVPFFNVILVLSEEIENCLNETGFWNWIWIEYLLYCKHFLVRTFNRIRTCDCRSDLKKRKYCFIPLFFCLLA